MRKIIDEVKRFPEVEKAIIDLLENNGGLSDYITLQRLLPDVSGRKFRVSASLLIEDGKIKTGPVEEVKTMIQCKETLKASALSVSILLVQE